MSFWQRIIEKYPPETLLTQGLKILGIMVGALVVNYLAQRALRRVEQRAELVEATRVLEARRAVTAVGLAGSVVRWVIFLLAVVMILREAGINATPILAGAGIAGLAVGFGAQTLVRDVVSGFLIILEGQLAVGDRAEINNVFGVVDEIGLRTTRMVVPGGQLRYFNNGTITSIVRYPSGAAPYVIIVPVPPEQTEQAREAIVNILADLDAEHPMFACPPQVHDVLDLPSYGHVVRISAEVLPAGKPAFEARTAARITALLAERGIAVPQGREVAIHAAVTPGEQVTWKSSQG